MLQTYKLGSGGEDRTPTKGFGVPCTTIILHRNYLVPEVGIEPTWNCCVRAAPPQSATQALCLVDSPGIEPGSHALQACAEMTTLAHCPLFWGVWPGSNRHWLDSQSRTLPIKLHTPSNFFKLVAGGGFEPPWFGLWDQAGTNSSLPCVKIFHQLYTIWRTRQDSNLRKRA